MCVRYDFHCVTLRQVINCFSVAWRSIGFYVNPGISHLTPLCRQCMVPNDTAWLLDISDKVSHPDPRCLSLHKTSISHHLLSIGIVTRRYDLFQWELFLYVECDGSRLVAGNQVWTRPCAQVVILHEAMWVMDWLNRIWAIGWHCFNNPVKGKGL